MQVEQRRYEQQAEKQVETIERPAVKFLLRRSGREIYDEIFDTHENL